MKKWEELNKEDFSKMRMFLESGELARENIGDFEELYMKNLE